MFPPSIHSPEYFKPYKPQNNTGCCACGGCNKKHEEVAPRRVQCCNVRYTTGSSCVKTQISDGQCSRSS